MVVVCRFQLVSRDLRIISSVSFFYEKSNHTFFSVWNPFQTILSTFEFFRKKKLRKILTDEIDEIFLSPSEVRTDDIDEIILSPSEVRTDDMDEIILSPS